MFTTGHPEHDANRSELDGLTDFVEIGRGGNATVYRAHHEDLDRTVAVKCLDGRLVGRELLRFDRECDALRTLGHHPNICGLIECRRSDDGRAAIVLDYHARGSLADANDGNVPIEWPEAFRIGAALAGALETSHRAGILHRDVTPSNVLLDELGVPVLADFGLARTSEGLTRTGELRATIEHAPPEAFAGQTPAPAADIYSLASTVYELVAGHAPLAYDQPTAMTLIARLASTSPPDLTQNGVPRDVWRVLERGLAKDPADRYATAAEMAMAMNDALGRHGMRRAMVSVSLDGPTPHTVSMAVPLASDAFRPLASEAPTRSGTVHGTHKRSKHSRILAVAAAIVLALVGFVVTSSDQGNVAETDVAAPLASVAAPADPLDTIIITATENAATTDSAVPTSTAPVAVQATAALPAPAQDTPPAQVTPPAPTPDQDPTPPGPANDGNRGNGGGGNGGGGNGGGGNGGGGGNDGAGRGGNRGN